MGMGMGCGDVKDVNNNKDDGAMRTMTADMTASERAAAARGGVQFVPSGALLLLAQRDSLAFFALFLSSARPCVCVTGNCHLKCILESRSVRRKRRSERFTCVPSERKKNSVVSPTLCFAFCVHASLLLCGVLRQLRQGASLLRHRHV